MKKFTFSLQAVLDMRKHREDDLKRTLADKLRQIGQVQKQLGTLAEDLRDFQKNELQQRAQAHDVVHLRHSVNYRNKIKLEMIRVGQQLDHMKADADGTRRTLVDATQQRRAIEVLKEKRYSQWRKDAAAREQEIIDDVSQSVFLRGKLSSAVFPDS